MAPLLKFEKIQLCSINCSLDAPYQQPLDKLGLLQTGQDGDLSALLLRAVEINSHKRVTGMGSLLTPGQTRSPEATRGGLAHSNASF